MTTGENIINNNPITNNNDILNNNDIRNNREEINQNNSNNETSNITNSINFSNPINDDTLRNNTQRNNANINNYLSQVNGLFEFFVNPLKKTIKNLNDEKLKLKNEIKEKDDKIEELDKKCSVCFTNKSNIIYIPCGHLCMCNECNNKCADYNMSFCPICRNNGTRYVVYA